MARFKHTGYSPHEIELRLLSNDFTEILLKYYRNRIAYQLLHLNYLGYYKDSNRNFNLRKDKKMSYCPSGKDTVLKENGQWDKTNRFTGKYGKTLKKILIDQVPNFKYKPKELEELVNMLKAEVDDGEFSIVSGDDIAKMYNSKTALDSVSLKNSCMQGSNVDYFDIYVKNPNVVNMLALTKCDDTLVGRALLWTVGNDTYMDRIYGNDSTIQKFIDYAKENNIIRKEYQSYDEKIQWILPNGNQVNRTFSISLKTSHNKYPYVDTFSYMNSGYLSNDVCDEHEYSLTSTNGGTEEPEEDEDYVYCEIDGDRVHMDDAVWIDGHDYYVGNDYAITDDWNCVSILVSESVETLCGDTTHQEDDDLVYCEASDGYAHCSKVFECEFDGKTYYSGDNNEVYLDELNITVHEDNVDAAYEDKGYVCDDNGGWILEEELEKESV